WATTEGRYMQRRLTATTNLRNLRREAKRWLRALRENNRKAHERFDHAYPKHAETPMRRDVQHALACEHNLENWKELKLAVKQAKKLKTGESWTLAARRAAGRQAGGQPARPRGALPGVEGGPAAMLAGYARHYSRSFSAADLKAEIWRRDLCVPPEIAQ